MFQPMAAFPGAVQPAPLALSESTMPLSFEGTEASEAQGGGFSQILGQVIDEVEAPKALEDKLTMDYLAGKDVDTHDIMIAGAQGDLMLQMSSAVISKVANAYQTLINMQV